MSPFPLFALLSAQLAQRTFEERYNTLTHFCGLLLALGGFAALRPAFLHSSSLGWGMMIFVLAMCFLYFCSTCYHWSLPGVAKLWWRKFDHISIYAMIAGSYTPICLSVVGGWRGWAVLTALWLFVLGGAVYKLTAIDRFPRLSLGLYLAMGWSGVLIARSVWEGLSTAGLVALLLEGLAYTAGTYFFAHDDRRGYHAVWHLFVLIGSLSHWVVILTILL